MSDESVIFRQNISPQNMPGAKLQVRAKQCKTAARLCYTTMKVFNKFRETGLVA